MKRDVPPIAGYAMLLRPVTEADLERTLAWRNRDDTRLWFKTSSLITPEQHQAWFSRYRDADDDFVFIAESGGEMVGQVSVYDIDWASRCAQVGRLIAAPRARGRGHITRACSLLVQWCTDVLELRHLYAEVMDSNRNSIGVFEKNGFARTAQENGLVRMQLDLPDGHTGIRM